jgi:hypothetical protein
MVKLLIDYAIENKIILELDEKDNELCCNPINIAISNNNFEVFKLLVEYAMEKGKIKLIIDENSVEELISKDYYFVNLRNISEISHELITLIYLYKNKDKIDVIYSENSYFLKRFNEINERYDFNTLLTFKYENNNIEKEEGSINEIWEINETSKDRENDGYDSKLNEMIVSKDDIFDIKIFENMKKSICYISRKNFHGTGFFIEIPIPSKEKPMRGLMTNNHILNEKSLKSGKTFNIYMDNNKNKAIEIKIEDKYFVFTSELIDVTFIELNKSITDEINPIFLHPAKNNAKINDKIHIFQFPNKNLSYANGTIKSFHSFDYYHDVSTDYGSLGSPLLNKNFEVIGVHKARRPMTYTNDVLNENINVNLATRYSEIKFAIRTLYNNMSTYGIERAKKSAEILDDYKISMLNEYGLKLKLSLDELKKEKEINKYELEILPKLIFECKFSKDLLFYRTNYAWYITILSEENKISKYTLDCLKQLDWSSIKPNSKVLRENIITRLNGREYVLITRLNLSKLKYL